jgi:aspartate ammonia-lyase
MKQSHQRTARDLRGEAQVPAETFRGAQTLRAGKDFGIGAQSVPAESIRPPVLVTGAAPRSRAVTDVAAELDVIDRGRPKRSQDPGGRPGSGLPEEGQG